MTDLATNPATEPEIDALDIDSELIEEACRQTGMSTNAVINHALRLMVNQERARRLRAYDKLQRMAAEGYFDFDALDGAN